jgi:hypothetical protein
MNSSNMKKLFLIVNLILCSALVYPQNGNYRCNSQRFTDDNNPSNNKEHNNSMIVTIDINDITGGYVIVSWPSEDFTYKWDIIKKLDTSVNTENKTVFTSYEARFNVANVQGTTRVVVVLIQDMKDESFHIAVNNPDAGTTNWYHNLIKIKN